MKRAGIESLEIGHPGLAFGSRRADRALPMRRQLNVQKGTDRLRVIMNDAGGNVAVLPTGEGILLVDDKFGRQCVHDEEYASRDFDP